MCNSAHARPTTFMDELNLHDANLLNIYPSIAKEINKWHKST
ncbi:hypothetical protein [Acinetobacter sp. c3-l95]